MTTDLLHTDRSLLPRIAGGDGKAFSELFYGYQQHVRHFIQLFTNNPDDTSELLQEVFTRLWINREQLVQVRDFDAYLFVTCKNITLNHIRKSVSQRKRQEAYFLDMQTQPHEEETDELNYTEELLEKAVRNLPLQQQQVFRFRRQGLKNPEISKRMNLSVESVKKYQYLALKFVSKFIKTASVVLFFLFFF